MGLSLLVLLPWQCMSMKSEDRTSEGALKFLVIIKVQGQKLKADSG